MSSLSVPFLGQPLPRLSIPFLHALRRILVDTDLDADADNLLPTLTMATLTSDNQELLSALDQLFAKYFEEKESFGREKTSQDKFWGTYLRAMRDEDEARPKDWDGNTGSILTFTGLFAATVAAFVIESYKSLSRDSGDQTVVLLSQILAATTNSSFDPATANASTEAFHAPLPAVLANALWFISLIVALACALLATLVQQWSRDYVRDIKQRETLDESFSSRALNHMYIRMGVDRYGMDSVVNLIVALVHLAVILFATGLLLFLFPLNDVVSWCTVSALAVFGLAYLIAGILPIFDTSCPYKTPLTSPCTLGYSFLQRMDEVSTHRRRLRDVESDMLPTHFKFMWQHTSRQLIDADASSFKILLESTLDILRLMWFNPRRSECLDHLLGNKTLALRLDNIGHLQKGSPDSDTYVATLKLTCLLLRRSYTKLEMWMWYNIAISHYLSVLFSMIRKPEGATNVKKPFALPAQYCLYHLRWSFLLMAREHRDRSVSQFDSTRFHEIYFSEDYTESGLFLRITERHEQLEHPEAFLLLLNSWQYNDLDAIESRSSRADWSTNTSSCLVPLHDAACCRRRDGPLEHVAACTVLTMIAHLLRAPEPDRDALLQDHLRQYSELWDHNLPLRGWDREFEISIEDRRRAPSAEFLSVLREAGLDKWIETGDLHFSPPMDTSTGKFLAYEGGMFAIALSTLAECVDMSDIRSGLPDGFQWLLHTPSTLPTAALDIEGRHQTILGVADKVSTSDNAVSTPDATELNAVYSPHRGSFDLEHVVIDTAVGITSSQPSRHQALTGEHSRAAFISASLDEGSSSQSEIDKGATQLITKVDNAHGREREPLDSNDPRYKEQDPSAEAAGAYPACSDYAPAEHESSASSGEIGDAESPGVDFAEREEGGNCVPGDSMVPSSSQVVADQELAQRAESEYKGVSDGEETGQREK